MINKSHIFVAHCKDYNSSTIYQFLIDYFEKIGGIESFISSGTEVLIKPNLCGAYPPSTAITTHCNLIEEVVKICVNLGAIVTIGDNPIGKTDPNIATKLWEITGINDIVKKYGIKKSLLGTKGFKKNKLLIGEKVITYLMSKEYLEADIVINLPKFKSHTLMGFTGAIKNLFGTVPGRSKVNLHSKIPQKNNFAKLLVDIFSKRMPEIVIMDAVVGLEGNGPTTGGTQKDIGFLIAGNDALTIDSFCSLMIGLKEEDAFINNEAVNRKIGSLYNDQLLLNGSLQLKDCIITDFKLPNTFTLTDSNVIKKAFEIAKFNISVDKERCSLCHECIKVCPEKAVTFIKEIHIEKTKCIQCFCCQESCPMGAIVVSANNFYNDLRAIRNNKNLRSM